jgi:hypothetical protein
MLMPPLCCSPELAGLDWGVSQKMVRGWLVHAVVVDFSHFLIGSIDGVSARMHRVQWRWSGD